MRRSRLPASTVATRAAPSALDQAIESPRARHRSRAVERAPRHAVLDPGRGDHRVRRDVRVPDPPAPVTGPRRSGRRCRARSPLCVGASARSATFRGCWKVDGSPITTRTCDTAINRRGDIIDLKRERYRKRVLRRSSNGHRFLLIDSRWCRDLALSQGGKRSTPLNRSRPRWVESFQPASGLLMQRSRHRRGRRSRPSADGRTVRSQPIAETLLELG
jgi:hypothetical protein